MAGPKIDLPDHLSSIPTVSSGNDEEKAVTGLLDELKDQGGSDTSIPLSPQWLFAKQSDSKPDGRCPNSLSLNYGEANQKEVEKKDWRKLASENESVRRWREEERETGLLGRRESRDRRRIDRRVDNISTREVMESSRGIPSSDRWHDVSSRTSVVETRRDSKWSNRWGPEEKEVRSEKRTDADKEDAHHENQSALVANKAGERDAESREKWRPRHRMDTGSAALSSYRAAPGFSLEKGRSEGVNTGFTVGRGRASGGPHTKIPLGCPIAELQLDKNGSVPGKPSFLVDYFRYPRGKLLDIYRVQKSSSAFVATPELMEPTPRLTQLELVEPLAFVSPGAEEEAILGDIWEGRISGSGASDNGLVRKGKLHGKSTGTGEEDSVSDEAAETLLSSVIKNSISFSQDAKNGFDTGFSSAEMESGGLLSENLYSVGMTEANSASNIADPLGPSVKMQPLDPSASKPLASDLNTGLQNDPNYQFSSQPMEEMHSRDTEYIQSRNDVNHYLYDLPPDELSLFYQDPQGEVQGPFLGIDLISWLEQGFFDIDLPVLLENAPEGTPFRELGEIMPHLRVRDGYSNSTDIGHNLSASEGLVGNVNCKLCVSEYADIKNHNWDMLELENMSNEKLHSGSSEQGVSLDFTLPEGVRFQDSVAQDEEIVFSGRPGLGENSTGSFGIDKNHLSNPVNYLSKEHLISSQNDEQLHPFGLLWSELERARSGHSQSSRTASSFSTPNNLTHHMAGSMQSIGRVSDSNMSLESWSNSGRQMFASDVDVYGGDPIDGHPFVRVSQDPLYQEYAEQMRLQQLQQQHFMQQKNILSQHPHLKESAFDQESTKNLIQRQHSTQSLSDLEQFLAIQQHKQQQLEFQQRLLEQREQLIVQEKEEHAKKLMMDHIFRGGQLRDPSFSLPHSPAEPSGTNSTFGQMLMKKQHLQELQSHSSQHLSHIDPYVEQLIQGKLGHSTYQDRQHALFDLMESARHEQLHPLEQQIIQQEQLRARQIAMELNQQSELDRRPGSATWPVDETGQFMTATGGSRPHLPNPSDIFHQHQRLSRDEQMYQFERSLQLQEQQRGLYDPSTVQLDRSRFFPGDVSGMNLDALNAVARVKGLDIQEANMLKYAARQVGVQNPDYPFRHSEVSAHMNSAGGYRPDDMMNHHSGDLPESRIRQLHVDALQQQRELQHQHCTEDNSSWSQSGFDEEKSKQLLMQLLNQKSNTQNTQMRSRNERASFGGSVSSFHVGPSFTECMFVPGQDQESCGTSYAEHPQVLVLEEQASRRSTSHLDSQIMAGGSSMLGANSKSRGVHRNLDLGGKSYVNLELAEMERKKHTSNVDDGAKASAPDFPESIGEQIGLQPMQKSVVFPGVSGGFYSENMGQSDSFDEEMTNDRVVSTVHSRGLEKIIVKHRPASHTLSAHDGVSGHAFPIPHVPISAIHSEAAERKEVDADSAPVDREVSNATTTAATAKKENTNNSIMRFRRSSSCSDSDVSETSFIDMLKSSSSRKPPQSQPESNALELADGGGINQAGGGGRGGKKKGKKGRQIDPALLGFKVTSNRIMMGEIQRLED